MNQMKYIICFIAFIWLSTQADAQNATQKIKVNGVLDDWPNAMLFNKSSGTQYQLYNDQKDLYLAFRFTEEQHIKKILAAGFTLTINTNNKKNIKDAYRIHILPVDESRNIRQMSSSSKVDSTTIAQRTLSLTKLKELKLTGFNQVPDSIISIYNAYGIKIGAKTDEKGQLNYELCIPLSLIQLKNDPKTEIAINVQFDAVTIKNNRSAGNNMGGGFGRMGGGGSGFGGGRNGGGNGNGGGGNGGERNNNMNENLLLFITTTDFWDKYKMQ